MEISAKSWHYRVIHNSPWRVPNNLCKYFWVLVAAMLRTSVITVVCVAVVTIVIAFAVFAALAPFIWLANHYYPFIENTNTLMNLHMGALIGTGLYAYAVGSFIVHVYKSRRENARLAKRGLPPAPPGIVTQRYRDLKEKTCTLLTFTDVPEDEDY